MPPHKNMIGSPIRKGVMKVIDEHIDRVEQAHKDECKRLDEECKTKKAEALETAVQAVIGKIL